MSEAIKHECGVALIRLLKPIDFYIGKYGTPFYGLEKLYLLMEKQHNRGQDGAGVACIKLDVVPGKKYINRYRSNSPTAIQDIFEKIYNLFPKDVKERKYALMDPKWLKDNIDFSGELLLGHLRYGTHGENTIEACHPVVRQNNWKSRCLLLAGNFNMTNTPEQFEYLVELGQFPKEKSDTVTILEKIGHFLDEENEMLHAKFKEEGHSNKDISPLIFENLNIRNILTNSAKNWDGGYTIAGLIGYGDAFAMRDPVGIRPAYYYKDEEIVVVTSERPPIQTAFNVPLEKICEIKPGYALIIKKNGDVSESMFRNPEEKKACSFERIYFSRGTDKNIYNERKMLGKLLVPAILETINYDIKNTVFSYIPNTAEVAFMGMIEEIRVKLDDAKNKLIKNFPNGDHGHKLKDFQSSDIRIEKIAVKDMKLRTFITEDSTRNDMVAHIYDVTYGILKPSDTLVIVDDSIVRGTTLEKSILRMLDRLGPKKIIIISSAPQIRYPDCYGIDMSKMKDFIAFRAAIELIKDKNKENLLDKIFENCKQQNKNKNNDVINCVKELYNQFNDKEISNTIARIIKTKNIKADIGVIYQTIANLHIACPNHKGDWYFSGNYPTPGGNVAVNQAFINFMEGTDVRAY